MDQKQIQKTSQAYTKAGFSVCQTKDQIIMEKAGYTPSYIYKSADYKGEAGIYQDLFLNEILDFFKQRPEGEFTGKDISDELNLITGDKGWYMHMHLRILTEQGKLEKCDNKKGFKYKKTN